MKIVIFMQHPVQAYMYKYIISLLQKKGFEVTILIMEREEIISKIVKTYYDNYIIVGRTQHNLINKTLNILIIDWRLLKEIKKINPSKIVSHSTLYPGHISSILDIPYIGFCDTETAKFNQLMSFPCQMFGCHRRRAHLPFP